VVDVTYNTAYNLSTRQTTVLKKPDENSKDQYLAHLREDRAALPESIDYLVADGYYSKTKFIDGVTSLNLNLISKLRHDANGQRLYNGEQKSRGRHKRYDGKVSFDDLTRARVGRRNRRSETLYCLKNSAHFKRDQRNCLFD